MCSNIILNQNVDPGRDGASTSLSGQPNNPNEVFANDVIDSVTDLISKYNFKPKINFKQIHRSSNDTLLMYLDGTKQTNEENMKIEGGYLTFYNIEMTAVSLPKIHTDSCLIIEINTYRDLLKTDYPPIYLNEFNVVHKVTV